MTHASKVIRLRQETHDSLSIFFEKPEGFDYKPGQYCIFDYQKGEELIRRSYSLSSSPTEDHLQITVKHVPNGVMSTHFSQLKVGDELKFNGPVGKFVFDESFKDVVFIAGGSGISPFRGMMRYIIDKSLPAKVELIYGSRTPKDIILKEELEKFNNEHDNIKIFLTVDHGDDTWNFHVGFIDIAFITEATSNSLFDKDYFLIGPPPMVTHIKDALLKADVPEERVHMDAWG